MQVKNRILWITQTALFLALLISAQIATKPFGTLVTGSFVNTLLVLSTLLLGLSSGLTIAIISPFLALLFGIVVPLFELLPLIALGNAILVVFVHLVQQYLTKKWPIYITYLFSLFAGMAKAGFLFVSVVLVLVPLLNLPAPKAAAISTAFSLPQLITAVIGTTVAFFFATLIKKAIKR